MNQKPVPMILMKKINLVLYILCMLLCSCSEGCDDEHIDVVFQNGSSERVYYFICSNRTSEGDTLKSSTNPYKSGYPSMEAGEKLVVDFNKHDINRGVQWLIIKSSTMDKYDNKSFYEAEDICDNRFILTYNELEKMGFVIEYKDDSE